MLLYKLFVTIVVDTSAVTIDHAPVPGLGLAPNNLTVSAHKVTSVPAFATNELFVIVTWSVVEQPLFVIVHVKVFGPGFNALTTVL